MLMSLSEDSALHDEEDLDEPVFSLTSGKYRQAKRYGGAYLISLASSAALTYFLRT